ncbi:MAG: glycosyltransferase family 39 protein [Ruminiclostridium sp.]|nr:glycosyltransferase family 39 protein [Ruminiclostridium sp.]
MRRIVLTVSIAILIRSLVIYFLGLTPQGDYSIYLSVAKAINSGNLGNKFYFGIFPHALNYPIFISVFYRFFGELTWLPRAINLIFGALEVGIGTYIIEKCTNPRISLVGGLAIALNPSIIIFTLLSGGEPIYSSIINCAIFLLMLAVNSEKTTKKSCICLIAGGIVCAIGNFFRPSGIILVIAAVLIIFLYSNIKLKYKITHSLLIILSFTMTVWLTSFITTSVSGYKKPSYSFGWNLYIGANEHTKGGWNEKDADLFNTIKNTSDDPSEVQKYFFDLGVERYKNMGINSVSHFKRKLYVWFDEGYISRVVTEWQTQYTRFKSADLKQTFSLIINPYNLFVVIGAIIALIFLSIEKKAPLLMKIISFYMIGSIMLFMVMETATRYKGAYYSILTILAVYGYWRIFVYLKEHSKILNKTFSLENKK